MTSPAETPGSILVIGGGISGLAAAHRLTELAPAVQIRLLEAGPRLGGALATEQIGGYCVELGADSFITTVPWALDLCRRIGMENELVPTAAENRQAFVVRAGRLCKVPSGFTLMTAAKLFPMLRTEILSPLGKLRFLAERFIPRRQSEDDESLASFARRRLGREAFERLVQPLVGGIYTADPEQLSMQATMPRFLAMERRHGSLLKAARHPAPNAEPNQASTAIESGARYSQFVAPRDGMQSLVTRLADRLPPGAIQTNSKVTAIERNQSGGWTVRTAATGTAAEGLLFCDGLIIAAPATAAGRLLTPVDSQLSRLLSSIAYAGCAVVITAHKREQILHPLDGFGFVVPQVERRRILACSFSSLKFPDRAPRSHVLLRTFVGGALHPELAALQDDALAKLVKEELSELLEVRGEPEWLRVVRWSSDMPQYHVGHLDKVAQIEQRTRTIGRLALAGSAYRGVGIPHCVQSGERATSDLLDQLGER